MIDSIEKDLEQYLQTHPELSDFGYNNAYNNGDLIGIISAKSNMKKHERSYSALEERLSLRDDERAETSLFGGLVKSAIFAIVGSIPVLGLYAIHHKIASDIAPEIQNIDAYCYQKESWMGSYHVVDVDVTAYDADGDEISLSIWVTDGSYSASLTKHLPPYELSNDSKTQYFRLEEESTKSFGDGDVLIVTADSGFKEDKEHKILNCD